MKVLFIDSGIGGISTLATTCKLIPNLNFIYYADDKFSPYGEKNKSFLQKHLVKIINQFALQDIELVVLACNTATTNAIEYLRKKFSLKIIGTEPAIKLAAKFATNVLLIATPLTAKSKRLKMLSTSLNIKLNTLSLPNLAKTIDNYFLNPTKAYKTQLDNNIEIIKQNLANNTIIVLGCTHYCLIGEQITQKTNLPVLDGNLGVAKQIAKSIHKSVSLSPSHQFILSSRNTSLQKKYAKIFEQTLAKYNDV